MKRRSGFSKNAPPFGWRVGQFKLVGLPKVKEGIHDREHWGESVQRLVHQDAEYVDIHVLADPHGFVVVGLCGECGGRYERLVDCRTLARLDMKEAMRQMQLRADSALVGVSDYWVPQHLQCGEQPLQHRVPDMVQEFVDHIMARCIRDIERGRAGEGHLMMLMTDGSSVSFPIHDVPSSDEAGSERMNELTARKAALRDMVAARDFDVLAAVVVSEAWIQLPDPGTLDDVEDCELGVLREVMEGGDPSRGEALLVSVCTSSFNQVSMAPIRRKNGVMGQGPGEVGELRRIPARGESLLMDGLFATQEFDDATEAERQARAGFDFGKPYPA